MPSLYLKLMLTASLLIQCGGAALQQQEKSKPELSQIQTSTEDASKAECDFSAYAPVRIMHFAPNSIVKRVQPEYPPEAMRRGVQGQVTVKALVNENGVIERACAVEGDEALRDAASQAALHWRLKPKYWLAFSRPKTNKNPKNYADFYIVFTFKIDKTTLAQFCLFEI